MDVSHDLTTSEAWGREHPLNCLGQMEGGEAPSLDVDDELQEVGPRGNEGSQHRRCEVVGVVSRPVTKGATSGGTMASTVGRRAPKMAEASQSARLMLPADRGADIATARGDGAAMAPLGAGSQRIRAEEALGRRDSLRPTLVT
jgi:hypothetical protein